LNVRVTMASTRIQRLLLLAALATWSAADLRALTVRVAVVGTENPPAVIMAGVRRVDGDVPTARELELRVGDATSIELAAGTWVITTAAPAFWSAPVYASASDSVILQLRPRGAISGTLGSRAPAAGEFVVSFAPTRPSREQPGPDGIIVCPFSRREWVCSLPAGELDLRMTLPGFAAEFRWGVTVATDAPVLVGRLDFTPGSSVYGKVQLVGTANGELLRTAEVSARPVNIDERVKVPRYTATPDARGFFQIRGLPAGDFTLQAHSKDLVSDSRPIRIIAQTNASLKEPLVLAKPGRLAVRVTPPLDLQQQRWQIVLLRKQLGGDRADVIGQSLASATGEWSHQRVLPGEYLLMVKQQGGGEWSSQELQVGPAEQDRLVEIVLQSHTVAGKVTLGDRPIKAKVRFHGEDGPALLTDDQGQFRGSIPTLTDDKAKDDKATVLVTSDTPSVQRTLVVTGKRSPDGEVTFDIVLPATTIGGRTTNEDGSPIAAIVTVRSRDASVFEQMFSASDGGFQFAGFEPGTYVLQAEAFQKTSDVIDVEARMDAVTTDLILRPYLPVRGRIFMRGAPVAGAEVYAFPRGAKTAFMPQTASDVTGRFVLSLPPGTTTYDAVVVPRGFFVTAGRITIDPKMPDLKVEVGQNGGSLTVDAPDDQALLRVLHAGGEYSLSFLVAATDGVVAKADGRQQVTIPNLEPGTYSVCRNQACTAVYVPSFASATVTLD
jgi:hypothetical protein